MGLEIERRFLVCSEGWKEHAGPGKLFHQCYLVSAENGLTVRVRIHVGEKAWLTLKAPSVGIIRHEFEYLIPLADAEELWNLSEDRLVKKRYELNQEGGDWVVDCFEGENYPLVLAEIEIPSVKSVFAIPDWCGMEITGDSQMSNAFLAKKPISQWPVEQRKKRFFD